MTCKQCQTKFEYNGNCDECGVRLILSAYPVGYRAKQMSEYVKTYFKGNTDFILEESRKQWKCLSSR